MIDYSKTDKKLKDIADGLYELDKENAMLTLRTNPEDTILIMKGKRINIIAGLVSIMRKDRNVFGILREAVFYHEIDCANEQLEKLNKKENNLKTRKNESRG